MIHRLIARLQGGLGRLAGDRLAWRIAITILLGIVGTQIGTILLIDWARPKELSLYSVSAIVAEVSHFATSGGLDAMTADLEEVPVDEVEPLEPEIPHPWPLHELERRLRVSLENGPVVEVRIGPRHLRRPIGPLAITTSRCGLRT